MDVRSRIHEEMSPQLLDLMIPIDKKEKWHMNRTEEQRRTLINKNDKPCCEERKLELRLGPPGGEDIDESSFSLGCFSSQQTQKISTSPWPSSNISQKRTAPGPVVGWPPIRSYRKNLASNNNSKTNHETQLQHHQNDVSDKVAASGKKPIGVDKGLFVKINMDGVPIGRKVDLNAYDSYEKLSSAVDQLFRCLLAAQRDSCAEGIYNKKQEEEEEEEKGITGLLDGNGEYTLVYEDNEGDRMLVGDVPWHMFVSTVKRLRVLKTSELSAFTLGNKQHKKIT